jgi:hypothetical protein
MDRAPQDDGVDAGPFSGDDGVNGSSFSGRCCDGRAALEPASASQLCLEDCGNLLAPGASSDQVDIDRGRAGEDGGDDNQAVEGRAGMASDGPGDCRALSHDWLRQK